jgi:uncharacterized Zn-binding protein involved in type VI secretion
MFVVSLGFASGWSMPGQGRLGDKANVPLDAHGCPACPHPAIGPAILGSPDVNVNRRPALRVDDPGIHAACCGANTWTATKGSLTVFINGKGAHRMGDQNRHCGGMGQLVEGSPNVLVGETDGGGGGGGRRNGSASAGGASGGRGHGGAGGAPGGDPGSSDGLGSSGGDGGGSGEPATTAGASGVDAPPEKVDPHQIEITVVNALDQPAIGVFYEIRLSDGASRSGTTDGAGMIRITGIKRPGDCSIVFPDVDAQARKGGSS